MFLFFNIDRYSFKCWQIHEYMFSVFPAYISTLFLLLSLFRLTFRDILKRFRSQGKNIRYVVLVGSTSNNIEMYHELSDDPSTGYKVNGYFDDKPNPEMPSQCCYLGRPEEVQNYLKKTHIYIIYSVVFHHTVAKLLYQLLIIVKTI